jgi:DNA polymerase-3 subunit delta'
MVTRRAEAVTDDLEPLRPEDLALPWLDAPLQQALGQHRGHALLVCGHAGAGMLEFLLRLSQAWLCEGRASDAAMACGHCGSCRLFLSHTHPDFRLRVPEVLAVARGFPVMRDEKRKPSRQIRIDEVRQAIEWMTTTSGRGKGKVLALHPAEAMNAASASALLKTLEEPPPGARLVLSTADRGLLMPTVLSRCQMLQLSPPPRAQALAWLARKGLLQADVLLDGAGGMPLTALQWHLEGVSGASWLSLPHSVAAGDAAALSGWPIPRVVDALQKLCHDAASRVAGGEARFFPSARWPEGASLERLTQWYKSLQRVMQHAEHPWSEPLLIESLVAEGRAVWHPEPERSVTRAARATRASPVAPA